MFRLRVACAFVALVTSAACTGVVQDTDGGHDSGARDSGPADSGNVDAGPPDSGVTDSGTPDAGPFDAGIYDDPDAGSPWGIATSASSSRSLGGWLPAIADAGIHFQRGFDQSDPDGGIAFAASQGVELAGILVMSGPGPQLTFPTGDLTAWSTYVGDLVGRTRPAVRDWEVWNEPPNFTADTDPADYAALVASAYDAAKAVDPKVRVALCGKSVHVNWLDQALQHGAAGHFDYVTLHPYETLGLVDQGFDAEFFAISRTVRKMLHARDPAHENVPIVFTELGEPVGGSVSPQHQAITALKAYVLSLAQGIARIHWFEGRDGDSGPFGFLDGNGAPRPSYFAMKTLIETLGQVPRYRGWVLLDSKHYGFMFATPSGPVLVAWAQPGTTDTVSWGQTVRELDPVAQTDAMVTSSTLTPSPLIIANAPQSLLVEAVSHFHQPLPWNGDFSQTQSVSLTAPDVQAGLHPLAPLAMTTVNGMAARDCSGSASQVFTVDPNFLSYDTVPIQITAVLVKNGADAAGFNLKYESTSGTKSTGSWYAIPDSQGFVTQTWTINDAQFVGMWGYNFSFDSDSTMNSKYSLQSVTVTRL